MADDIEERTHALKVALVILLKALIAISPIIPFITEELYQRIFRQWDGKDSIHKSFWPDPIDSLDDTMVELGKIQIESIALIRNAKSKAKIALNKELSKVGLWIPKESSQLLQTDILPILKTLNIQQLDVQPLEIFSEDQVHENLISLEDEFTKWRVIIYSE